MQAENQVGPGQRLHVFDDFLVTFALGDQLIAPVGKGMGADRGDFQSAAPGEIGQFAPQLDHMGAGVLNRLADFGAELDH